MTRQLKFRMIAQTRREEKRRDVTSMEEKKWHPGQSLEAFGGVRGGLWEGPGGSGAAFGRLRGGLRGAPGPLEEQSNMSAICGAVLVPNKVAQGRPKGAQKEACWEAKRSQNRSQIEVAISDNKNCFLEAAWGDVDSILA